MCGRYQFSIDKEELKDIISEVEKRTNAPYATGEIYPTNTVPILTASEGKIEPELIKWGFPNYWNKGTTINARSETVFEKKMFKKSIETRRCIVPASGFFEWKEEGKGRDKTKYLFERPESPVLYMAGIYNEFDGEKRFVILTKDANNYMKEIHNRMPVILNKNQIQDWITDNEHTGYFMESASPMLEKRVV